MIWIIIILILTVIILLARLFYVKYQIINVTKQLKYINKNKSDNKVTCGLLNKDFEELITFVNENIEIRKQCTAERIRTENALKGAIADMSHDLRTPLTSVIGYLQFMKLDNTTAEERKEYLNIATERAEVLKDLLNDFYTLSLIDSADYEVKLSKLDLNEALRELLLKRYNEFTFRKLEMKFLIPETKITIIGDKRSVDRVIENLLSNVLKYAKNKVEISLNASDSIVILSISNDVTNLHQEDIEKLFDRFYMADKTRSGNGTGLGLAIAKSLMEKMGGDIRVSMNEDIIDLCCEFKKI